MKESINILFIYPQLDKAPPPIRTYTWCREDLLPFSEVGGLKFYLVDTYQPGDRFYRNIKIIGIPTLLSNKKQILRDLVFMVKNLKKFPFPVRIEQLFDIWNSCRIERYLSNIIKDEDIDIIDSHGIWPKGSGGMIAKMMTGCPLITNLYGGEILPTPSIDHGRVLDPFHKKMMSRVFYSSNIVTVANEYVRDAALSIGCPAEVIHILPEGVNLKNFHPDRDGTRIRKKLNIGDAPVVLCVAGLIKRKGVEYCVKAFKKAKAIHPGAKLILSGDGPEKAFLKKLVHGLDLDNEVFFVNQERDETPLYFAACDVFCLASLIDAAPYVLLEAAATAKPSVSSDVPGIRDCVIDGKTGFLVPPRDVDLLAEKISLLLSDRELREQMGKRGRFYVEKKFDFRKRMQEKIRIYRSCKQKTCESE